MYRTITTWALLIGSLLVAIFAIYRNELARLLATRPRYEFLKSVGDVDLEVSYPRAPRGVRNAPANFRVLKISFPLSYSKTGCEFIYGVVRYDFPREEQWPEGTGAWRPSNDTLIKFKYDLKWRRCESKDLSFQLDNVPSRVSIQFVHTDVGDERITETPEMREIVITPQQSTAAFSFSAQEQSIDPGMNRLKTYSTTRVPSFSFSPASNDSITPLIHPETDLREFLVSEIERRIQKCLATKICDPIQVAVAMIKDLKIVRALNRAAHVGMPVEVITNPGSRYYYSKSANGPPEEILFSLLEWRRGNTEIQHTGEQLPMHTKFVIFGDDLVVSTNGNFIAEDFPVSREVSTVYRSPTAVRIFKEIFTFLRTSAYYPKIVNLGDEVLILFHANRPHGYAASSSLPQLQIKTTEGVRSTAYGILYELLRRTPGTLRIAMSPLTNSCETYHQRLCLAELLRDRMIENELRLALNSGFYNEQESDDFKPLPKWQHFLASFGFTALDQLSFFRIPGYGTSAHHERYATLGDSYVISGSSNWARASTLNTVEILSGKQYVAPLIEEYETFNEPWFVMRKGNDLPRFDVGTPEGRCQFFRERELLRNSEPHLKSFRVKDLISKLAQQHPLSSYEGLDIIEPVWPPQSELELVLTRRPLPSLGDQVILSYSSYFCLARHGSDGEFVIRASQAKVD